MTMTNAEIVANYRQSKNKKAQIGILADLNVTDCATIKDILRQAGERVAEDRSKRMHGPVGTSKPSKKTMDIHLQTDPYSGPFYDAPCCLKCWTRPICSRNGYRCNQRARVREMVCDG